VSCLPLPHEWGSGSGSIEPVASGYAPEDEKGEASDVEEASELEPKMNAGMKSRATTPEIPSRPVVLPKTMSSS